MLVKLFEGSVFMLSLRMFKNFFRYSRRSLGRIYDHFYKADALTFKIPTDFSTADVDMSTILAQVFFKLHDLQPIQVSNTVYLCASVTPDRIIVPMHTLAKNPQNDVPLSFARYLIQGHERYYGTLTPRTHDYIRDQGLVSSMTDDELRKTDLYRDLEHIIDSSTDVNTLSFYLVDDVFPKIQPRVNIIPLMWMDLRDSRFTLNYPTMESMTRRVDVRTRIEVSIDALRTDPTLFHEIAKKSVRFTPYRLWLDVT